ncbi:hypothetical protein BJ912DRAFT_439213 [Pholiota molesta]|nr:hypothetical protein BJ912DRAFT_439213 [Pholiota molesta]
MAQLGPSPHIRPGGMMPPNGGPGMGPMNLGQPQSQQQGPPTPGYQQQQQQHNPGGRPPSRTNTPRSGMMSHAHASPSLAARQTPGLPGGPPSMGPGGQGMMSMAPGGISGMVGGVNVNPDQMNNEIMTIPQNSLNALKLELGCGDKELSNLSMSEKNRIINTWKQRQRKDGQGPPGMMQAPGQPGQQPQRPGAQPPQQRIKRNSTSPGEEHETLPRNESSPPDRKRVRRSPAEPPAMVPIPYAHPGQHPPSQQQQQQGQPPNQPQMSAQQQQQMNLLMQQRGMGGMNGMQMGVPPPQQQQQHPGLQGPMVGPSPSMMQMGGGNVMMSPQQQQMHVRNGFLDTISLHCRWALV